MLKKKKYYLLMLLNITLISKKRFYFDDFKWKKRRIHRNVKQHIDILKIQGIYVFSNTKCVERFYKMQ